MRQRRVLVMWVVNTCLLVALPDWLPSPPSGGWASWWSWALTDLQRAFVLVAGVLAFLIAAWLFLLASLTLTAGAIDPSGRAARRTADMLTPRFARGVLQMVLGAAVAVGPAAPALAAGSQTASVSSAAPGLASVPAPLVASAELPPLPELDRPSAAADHPREQPKRRRKPAAAATALPTHTVQPGDTLWALAAARLPAGSSPARITWAWQRLYAQNRKEIGPDPGLLLVGEQLVFPHEMP